VARAGARELSTDWRRVGALFEEALELDAEGRERVLARAAATDPALAAEVRALLRAHDTSGAFLEQPAWAVAPELLVEQAGDSLLTGARIGPYQIQEEVGRGGMGVVYAARDERLGRTVALKVLPRAFSRDGHARERLAREARAAAALSHPAIATIYALEEIEGELFLASELVRGITLRRTLADGRVAPSRALEILLQLAEALDAAHRQGIVHRDLKPENVLLTADGRIKVVDFGIARSLSSAAGAAPLTRTGTALGTPGYMAPEQLRGDSVDARADVFAFGVIAYELATGEHPFGGSDPASLVERLVAERSPLSRTLDPPALDAIVRRCLRGDRDQRFASGVELLDALRGVTDGRAGAPARPLFVRTAWWWKFHQIAVATITIVNTITLGVRKSYLGPSGSWVFLVVLVLATITTTLRLHLWFVSQVHPASLLPLRARVLRWVVLCESLLLTALLAIGIILSGPHDATAAQFVVTSLLLLLSLIVIEPATTRASLT
jgi:serine/threonine protein kinase